MATPSSRTASPSPARWSHPSSVLADLLRVAALVSAAATLPTQPLEVPLRFGLIALLLLVTRTLQLSRPFDAAFALLLLVSGWASAAGWYFEHPWVDIPIHFALTGATAAMLYAGLARLDYLPKPEHPSRIKDFGAVVLVIALLGGTASVVWEIYEWLAETYLPSRIFVGYDDAIGDMANGLAGSIVAGANRASRAIRSPVALDALVKAEVGWMPLGVARHAPRYWVVIVGVRRAGRGNHAGASRPPAWRCARCR